MRTRAVRRSGRLAIGSLVVLSMVAAACGGDDDDDAGDDESVTADTEPSTDTEAATEDTEAMTEDTEAATEDTEATEDTATDDTEPAASAPEGSAPPAPDVDPVVGGRLVVAGEAETANPWTPANMNCDSFCQMRARTFYDPLVVVNDQLEVEPFLAESIEANDDATVFTITLRDGITFHDGTPFNADAAMDNVNRNFTSLLIGASLKDIAKNDDGTVMMEKVDDLTFTISTGLNGNPAEPISWPLFPYYLNGQAGLMASPTWLAEVDAGNADPTAAVGTGPFVLQNYAPGDRLTVTKNPDYWLTDDDGTQLPYLDEIEFRVIVDSQVRSEALQSGDVDMIATSDSLVVGTLRDEGNFGYINQDQFSETNYILMNLTKPYLADQSVRCALTQAIDKEDYNNVVLAGFGNVSDEMFTPGQEGYLAGDNGTPPFDPDAAAAAIEEWEAENGDLTINYSTTPTSTNLAAAQYLADVWGQIGVDVTINQIEQSELINNALFGAEAFDAFGWRNHAGIFVDQQYFWWHSSAAADPGDLALNFGRLRDPEIDQLLEQQRQEFDETARRDLAEQINQRFAEQCFTIPTTSTQWGIFFDDGVQNIGRAPLPEGEGFMRDGAGFPGQVWMTAVFVTE